MFRLLLAFATIAFALNSLEVQNEQLKKTNKALRNALQAMKTNKEATVVAEVMVGAERPGTHTVTVLGGGRTIELTVVVVGDLTPTLTLNSGSYPGTWEQMAEGVEQFNDRNYKLTNVPDHLLGGTYYKGSIHPASPRGGADFTVESTGTIYVLASEGNKLNSLEFEPEAEDRQTLAMRTQSFSSSYGFAQWTFENPSEALSCYSFNGSGTPSVMSCESGQICMTATYDAESWSMGMDQPSFKGGRTTMGYCVEAGYCQWFRASVFNSWPFSVISCEECSRNGCNNPNN